jgi:hypothetical protein
MPNSANILNPVTFLGLGRSGTSAITEILSHHPQIEVVGETAPVIWDVYEAVSSASFNMRSPNSENAPIKRNELPARSVRDFFLANFFSTKEVWVFKPIGQTGLVSDRLLNKSSGEEFIQWYFEAFQRCFPEALVFSLVRDPLEYARSARRYWGASFSNVKLDIEFMSLILSSGKIDESNVIDLDLFKQNPRSVLNSILSKCSVSAHEFEDGLFSKSYARSQGVYSDGENLSFRAPPFSTEEEKLLLSFVGGEYRKYMKSEAHELLRTSDSDIANRDVNIDFKESYYSLVDEYVFLKSKIDGLQNSVNTKEDTIQDLLHWIKILEIKSNEYASVLSDNQIPVPSIKDKIPLR